MARATRDAQRASWRIRAGIWVLATVAFSSCLALSGVLDVVDLTQAPSNGTMAADQPTSTFDGRTPPQVANPAQLDRLVAATGDGNQLLPAYRWRDALGLFDAYSITQVGQTFTASIAEMLFSLAALAWWLLLTLLDFAFSAQFLRWGGNTINAAFVALSEALFSSGVILVLVISGLVLVAIAVLKGKVSNALTTGLGVLLPVAFLGALTISAGGDASMAGGPTPAPLDVSRRCAPGETEGCTNDTYAAGSPVWIADTAMSAIDDVVAGLGSITNVVPLVQRDASQSGHAMATANPSCVAYTDALYAAYERKAGLDDANRQLALVSRLWEQTMLPNWASAQYGNGENGSRMWCHQLEGQRRTTREEQVTIASAAGYPGFHDRDGWVPGADVTASLSVGGDHRSAGTSRPDPFQWNVRSDRAQEATLFAWAACTGDAPGSLQMYEAWAVTGNANGESCTAWWLGGYPGEERGDRLLEWRSSTLEDIEEDIAVSSPGTPRVLEFEDGNGPDVEDVTETVLAFRGGNGPQRLLLAVISLAVALVYLWAFGLLALSVVIAQIGAVVMLILLPGTLVLLALPGTDRRLRHPLGKRMLFMTIGFVASTLLLSIALIVVINLIIAVQTIVPGGAGSIWSAVVPLAVMIVLHKLLKRSGLGSIMSPKGSLGLAASAAYASGFKPGHRANAMTSKNNQFDRSVASAPRSALDKFNRLNRLKQPGALGKALKGSRAAAAATKVGSLASKAALATGVTTPGGTPGLSRATGLAPASPLLPPAFLPSLPGAALPGAAQGAGGHALLSQLSGAPAASQLAGLSAALGATQAASTLALAGTGAALASKMGLGSNSGAVVPGELGAAMRRDATAELAQRLEGKDPEERAAILAGLGSNELAAIRSAQQLERLPDGSVAVDPYGEPIYGFTQLDAEGNAVALVGADAAGFDPETGLTRDGFSTLSSPVTALSSADQENLAARFADDLGLPSGLARPITAVAANGLAPILLPSTSSEGTKVSGVPSELARSDDLGAVAEAVRSQPHLFLPAEAHEVIYEALGSDQTALAEAYTRIDYALGGGAVPDLVSDRLGVDLSSVAGQQVLADELNRQIAGSSSALDDINVDDWADVVTSAVAAARLSASAAASSAIVDAAREARDATLAAVPHHVRELNDHLDQLSRLGTDLINADELEARLQHADDEQGAKVQEVLSRLNAKINGSTASLFATPAVEHLDSMLESIAADQAVLAAATDTIHSAGTSGDVGAALSRIDEAATAAAAEATNRAGSLRAFHDQVMRADRSALRELLEQHQHDVRSRVNALLASAAQIPGRDPGPPLGPPRSSDHAWNVGSTRLVS